MSDPVSAASRFQWRRYRGLADAVGRLRRSARPQHVSSGAILGQLPALAAVIVATGIAGLASGPADAAPLPNGDRAFLYAVVDQPLADVLSALGDQIGVTVSVSKGVTSRVRGRIAAAPASQTLDRLGAIYQFDWYFYGGMLYISASTEATSALLRLSKDQDEAFFAALQQLKIEDPRWPIRISHDAEVAAVNGPPEYVKLVQQALNAVTTLPQTPTVQIFRGAQ